MKKTVCFLGLAGILLPSLLPLNSAWGQALSWSGNFIDPHPLKDDFSLPMPCGGAMTFRRVDVPTEGGVLDDISVQTGQEDTQQGYSDYIRKTQLDRKSVV